MVKRVIAPWACTLSQNAAKYSIIDLGSGQLEVGRVPQEAEAGHQLQAGGSPTRFKRRRHEQGFRSDNGPDTVRVDGKTVILPRIGRVAMVEQLRFAGRICEATVNRTAGQWFASFSVDTGEPIPPGKDGPTIGVDVGIAELAVVFLRRLWRLHA